LKLLFIILASLSLLSCATAPKNTAENTPSYTIRSLSIDANGFAGNIVVEVYDVEGNPINEFRTILREGKEVIFDVPQKNHQCTFFKDGHDLTLEIQKTGYETLKTEPFITDEELDNAQFIRVTLYKK
jgi:hypothetical protein